MTDPKHEKTFKTPPVVDVSAKGINKADADARAAKTAELRKARVQRDIDNPAPPTAKGKKR